ncbi:hypothetical protein NliqN6_1387 [Naganishia liquefaciens]|uniref:Uncharacterized protein n=1 Tax=Naganishia liquefaciens TaxID=104408 RepID=A0A8H3YD38_9TREE|nr:hypothetical protein NliqN6_1387 [Naganishia liquefaciens]
MVSKTISQTASQTSRQSISRTTSQTIAETADQTLSAAGSNATSAHSKLSARQNFDRDCSWTTTTQWKSSQPSSTVIINEVIATSTVWNTVTAWMPTETVQECTQIESSVASSSSTSSPEQYIPLPRGTAATPSGTNKPIVLTWTEADAKYTTPPSTTSIIAIRFTSPANTDNTPIRPISTAFVSDSQSVETVITATDSSDGETPSAQAATESSTSRNSSASAKAGWACGTFGVLLLLGLIIWLYLRKRQHSKQRSTPRRSREKFSFFDGSVDEKGEDFDANREDYHEVPLFTLQTSDTVPALPEVSMLKVLAFHLTT